MTGKELLYLEDAIKHEKNIVSILEESVSFVDDEELVSFLESEQKKHKVMINKLMETLESEAE